jgi:hypothetical protein
MTDQFCRVSSFYSKGKKEREYEPKLCTFVVRLVERNDTYIICEKEVDMSKFIFKDKEKQIINFENLTDYPGLALHVEWSIDPTNLQKPKTNVVDSLTQASKYTDIEVEIFFRQTH